jgi:hypothetical protein
MPAEVSVSLDAGGHKGVTGVQMVRSRPVLVPDTQSGRCAACPGDGGNVGQAARMMHGDIRQCGAGEGALKHNACPP